MAPVPIDLGPLFVIFAAVLGALIGSFANVVIYRLPRGESIAFPGSHCPHCNHELSPLELVPVISWLMLKGRCKSCGSAISMRYPLVEALMAAGFVIIWLKWPAVQMGWSFLPLAALFAVLVILAAIDLDTFTLPDVLTLPALAVALLAPLIRPPLSGLPTLSEALLGAGLGAGILVLVNRIGALVLRRFRDTGERLWPIGFDQVNIAALAGALAGWQTGVACGIISLALNLVLHRPVRIPEPLLLSLWLVALLLAAAGITISPFVALAGSLVAAGAVAMAGALYWWIAELSGKAVPQESLLDSTGTVEAAVAGKATAAPAPAAHVTAAATAAEATAAHATAAADATAADATAADADEEPVAMGFGDVKLAAVLGAMLGWEKLLLAVFLSFVVGALGGVTGRLMGGERTVPFGPYLVAGALIALFLGDAVIGWYLGLLAL